MESFVLATKQAKRPRPSVLTDDRAPASSVPLSAFVASFSAEEPSLAEALRPPPRVIPAMQNTNLLVKEQHRLPGAAHASSAAGAAAAADAIGLAIPAPQAQPGAQATPPTAEDENASAAAALLAEVQNGIVPAAVYGRAAAVEARDAQAGPLSRPSDAQDIAYDEMPVEDFGRAMLRGMGWEDGLGVGRNMHNPNQPIEYVARHHRLGLGARPGAAEPPRAKRPLRPGESCEPRPDLVYVDAEGRQRHVMPIGEQLTVRAPTGFQVGALVTISRGAHAGLDATILSVGGLEAERKAMVALSLNGTKMLLPLTQLAPAAERAAAAGSSQPVPPPARADANANRGSAALDAKRERASELPQQRSQAPFHVPAAAAAAANAQSARSSLWVTGSIRVRVVDQKVHRGALYNRKGVIVDTGRAGEFTLLMDADSSAVAGDPHARLREGIRQGMVETALPKTGGLVLVVKGEQRGRRGKLLERDSRADRAIVQLNGDFAICTFGFDDISEWAGPAEDADDDEF